MSIGALLNFKILINII